MANPINSNIGPHVNADTTGATALIMRAMTDPNNNVGNQLYKLYGDALDTYRTNQGTLASLEAKALFDQGKTFTDVLPLMQDKYSAGALAKAKLGDVYSGSLKDITERDANQRGWNSDARDDVRLGYEGDRVKIAQGELDVNRGRLGVERARLQKDLADAERQRKNNALIAKWLSYTAASKDSTSAFFAENKALLADPDYAEAAKFINNDAATRGYSVFAPQIPGGTTVKMPYMSDEGLAKSAAYLQTKARGNVADAFMDFKEGNQFKDLADIKEKYLKDHPGDSGKFDEAVAAARAAGLEADDAAVAFLLRFGEEKPWFTWLNGKSKYDKASIYDRAKALKEALDNDNGSYLIRKNSRRILDKALNPEDPSNLAKVITAGNDRLRKIDLAEQGGLLSAAQANQARALVGQNLSDTRSPVQATIDTVLKAQGAEQRYAPMKSAQDRALNNINAIVALAKDQKLAKDSKYFKDLANNYQNSLKLKRALKKAEERMAKAGIGF